MEENGIRPLVDAVNKAVDGRRILVGLDDVWKKKDGSNPAAPIMNALRGTTATVLVTSRDGELLHKDLGVAVHRIALLNDDDALRLMGLWACDSEWTVCLLYTSPSPRDS